MSHGECLIFFYLRQIKLSQGDQDSLDNVQAICPNCHRKMHFG
ncbi:hypothetical protein C0W96_06445 [Photobacterium kishitanii]|nr:hypothetical protein C0W96_06445 [Photobacterium kishitanii]PSV78084.1 hypothetical protein C0W29_01790 [Photobacterium kishitanii]